MIIALISAAFCCVGMFFFVVAKDEHESSKRIMNEANNRMDKANKVLAKTREFCKNNVA